MAWVSAAERLQLTGGLLPPPLSARGFDPWRLATPEAGSSPEALCYGARSTTG